MRGRAGRGGCLSVHSRDSRRLYLLLLSVKLYSAITVYTQHACWHTGHIFITHSIIQMFCRTYYPNVEKEEKKGTLSKLVNARARIWCQVYGFFFRCIFFRFILIIIWLILSPRLEKKIPLIKYLLYSRNSANGLTYIIFSLQKLWVRC